MERFIGYFSVAIVIIVVFMFMRAARRESLKEKPFSDRMNFVVSLSMIYRVIGIVCAALFGSCLVLSYFSLADDPARPFIALIFTVFCSLGLYLTYYSHRWRLIVADDTFVLTPLFGKDKSFFVRDVTHILTDPTFGVRVYEGDKKLFTVNRVSVGSAMFVSYLIENGVRVPDRINL